MDKAAQEVPSEASDTEQMAQIMAEIMSVLPPQTQFGFFQQIVGAANLAQMMQEESTG